VPTFACTPPLYCDCASTLITPTICASSIYSLTIYFLSLSICLLSNNTPFPTTIHSCIKKGLLLGQECFLKLLQTLTTTTISQMKVLRLLGFHLFANFYPLGSSARSFFTLMGTYHPTKKEIPFSFLPNFPFPLFFLFLLELLLVLLFFLLLFFVFLLWFILPKYVVWPIVPLLPELSTPQLC
jgi:hypothetical protein